MKPILSIREGLLIVFLLLANQFAWSADRGAVVDDTIMSATNRPFNFDAPPQEAVLGVRLFSQQWETGLDRCEQTQTAP